MFFPRNGGNSAIENKYFEISLIAKCFNWVQKEEGMQDLKDINLNMLTALKILLEECNVSTAAIKLNTSQPTMSRNLSQLREYFNDPLLVRSGKEYVLTEKAKSVQRKVNTLLGDIRALFATEFTPNTHSKEFIIAAPDYVVNYVLCDALSFLFSVNNKITFSIIPWDTSSKRDLIAGKAHLAISMDNRFPGCMHRRIIDEDELVLVCRPQHPILGSGPTIDDFLSYPHISVKTGGGWYDVVDHPLKELGLQRSIKLSVYSYEAAFSVASRTDLLAIVPRHVARNDVAASKLVCLPPPLELPKLEISIWWHEVHHNDPAHKWLREVVFPKILSHPKQLGLCGSSKSEFPKTKEFI